MITDTMTKYEVMRTLRKEFDEEILPLYYRTVLPLLRAKIQQKCLREKKMVNLGWEEVLSTSRNHFKILKRGDQQGDKPLFVCEFIWNRRMCYGNFFPEQHVVIYQGHSLQRYAERVLNKEIGIKEVFYNYIVKKQCSAYNITLPTPTHNYSQYFGLANALFLGDFDTLNPKVPYLWINTCISYNEARYSQSRIMKSLHELQTFIEGVGDDLSKVENCKQLKDYLKKYRGNERKIEELKRFFILKYLLWQLHISFKFPFTKLFDDEINKSLSYIEKNLVSLDITPAHLSPFSKFNGIAWKGEIDFKG